MGNKISVSCKLWGTYQGEDVFLYRLTNGSGAFAEFTNYGASVVTVGVPDRFGESGDVVLGFPVAEAYFLDRSYIGATIGRFANRIAGAQFELDGNVYFLEQNDEENSNHGGENGFHRRVFEGCWQEGKLSFSLFSRDGEGGYPGNVRVYVDYEWSDKNELGVTYRADSDKRTILNFTNHAYFNLSGGRSSALDHCLSVNADKLLEPGAGFLPTGKVISAGKKAFSGETVRSRMYLNGDLIPGLNDYYILKEGSCEDGLNYACTLSDCLSGRKMEVFTSYPGVLVYTGDYLGSEYAGNIGRKYRPYDGLCLECQFFPGSPGHPHFPSTVISPGETYREQILYRFSVDNGDEIKNRDDFDY